MNIKEQLEAACAPPEKDVIIKGVAIKLVGLTLTEKMALTDFDDGFDATFWLIERMARDTAGARIFDDADPSLRTWSEESVEELVPHIRELLDMEEQVKNSEAA